MEDTGFEASYDQNTGEFARIGSSEIVKENMKPVTVLKGLTPVRLGLGIYGGAEWNLRQYFSIYAEGGFNYGITPALQIESGHLVNRKKH